MTSEKKSKIFGVALTPSLKEDLQALCRIKGVSVNSFIEGLVKEQVQANADKIQKFKELNS